MSLSLNLPYPVCYPLAHLARWLAGSPPPTTCQDQAAYFDHQYASTRHMQQRFMAGFPFDGAVLLDVGCGLGGRAPYWLESGAKRVVCIDINRQELDAGRAILDRKFPSFKHRVDFLHPDEVRDIDFADAGVMFDVFEHLTNPADVLRRCHGWSRPGGRLWIGSIGWYHYLASHCHSHIPIYWSQLLFSERAMIGTIRKIIRGKHYTPNVWERLEGLGRWDNVKTLKDRPGEPLNMLSLRGVKKVLRASPFRLDQFRVHGFSGRRHPVAWALSAMASIPLLREVFHSYYTAVLSKSS
jgi:SAM-dependent methyltransferase